MHLPEFPVRRYLFRARLADSLQLADYSGSILRGVFGKALRDSVCVTRQPACADCMLYRSCAYAYLFETPPPPNSTKMRLYTAAPHPFVIEPPMDPKSIERGGVLDFSLVLVGRANAQLPVIVHAWTRALAGGLGKARSRASLESVHIEDTPGGAPAQRIYATDQALDIPDQFARGIPPAPETDRLVFNLLTPMRLQDTGQLIRPQALRFRPLFSTLLRRISMLSHFHTDSPLETDFKALVDAAELVSIQQADLHWRDWVRYSGRQKKEMQFGGLMGHFEIQGDLKPFWPYLYLGQWLHVGKNATFGLGRYALSG